MQRLVLATVLALAGCASSGIGDGVLQSPGKPGERADVRFDWRAGADPTEGHIEARLPDGRVFTGRYAQDQVAIQRRDLGPYWSGWDEPWYGPGRAVRQDAAYERVYSGRLLAQLRGPEGERMRCVFQLARPEQGPEEGGTGACELSTGERIEYAELRGR